MNEWQVIDYVQAGMLARHKTWRAGQGLFNAILLVRPDIAEEIRGTEMDPFHRNDRIRACLLYLNTRLAQSLMSISQIVALCSIYGTHNPNGTDFNTLLLKLYRERS